MRHSTLFGNSLFNELVAMQKVMNHLLINDNSDSYRQIPDICETFPPTNLLENGNGYLLECQLPGYSMEDIDLTMENNTLTIKGTNKSAMPEEASLHRQERHFGSFNRSFTLPSAIDVEAITAKLSNGLLLVNLPKAAAAQAHRIAINND